MIPIANETEGHYNLKTIDEQTTLRSFATSVAVGDPNIRDEAVFDLLDIAKRNLTRLGHSIFDALGEPDKTEAIDLLTTLSEIASESKAIEIFTDAIQRGRQ